MMATDADAAGRFLGRRDCGRFGTAALWLMLLWLMLLSLGTGIGSRLSRLG
jgi:hypothetical protein